MKKSWPYICVCLLLATTIFSEDDKNEQLFEDAQGYVSAREHKKALKIYRELAEGSPNTEVGVRARLNMAHIMSEQHKDQKAFSIIQNIIDQRISPELKEPALKHQMELIRKGMENESEDGKEPGKPSPKHIEKMLEQALFNAPRGEHVPEIYYRLGLYYEQQGRKKLALTVYHWALNKTIQNKYSEKMFFAIIRCHYALAEKNRTDIFASEQALEAVRQFMKQYPTSSRITTAAQMEMELQNRLIEQDYAKAVHYEKMGETQIAHQCYIDMLKKNPTSPLTRKVLDRISALSPKEDSNKEQSAVQQQPIK